MWFLLVFVSAGLGFVGGLLGHNSLRDPLTLLVFACWLISIGAVLSLGDPRRRPPPRP